MITKNKNKVDTGILFYSFDFKSNIYRFQIVNEISNEEKTLLVRELVNYIFKESFDVAALLDILNEATVEDLKNIMHLIIHFIEANEYYSKENFRMLEEKYQFRI